MLMKIVIIDCVSNSNDDKDEEHYDNTININDNINGDYDLYM